MVCIIFNHQQRERIKRMEHFIGEDCYKMINGKWHKLSFCGFVWRESALPLVNQGDSK